MSKRGVPLSEALKKYSSPSLWGEFERYGKLGERLALMRKVLGGRMPTPSTYYDPFIEAERNLVTPFLEQLQTGELVATGHHKNQPLTPGSSKIPAELWNSCQTSRIRPPREAGSRSPGS